MRRQALILKRSGARHFRAAQVLHSFGSSRSLYGYGLHRFGRRRACFTVRFFRLALPSGNELRAPSDGMSRHGRTSRDPDARCSGNGSAAGSSFRADPMPDSAARADTDSCAYESADSGADHLARPNVRNARFPNGNACRPFRSHTEAHAAARSYRGEHAGTHEKSSDCNALSFHGH